MFFIAPAQDNNNDNGADSAEIHNALQFASQQFPKFYHELTVCESMDSLIKGIKYYKGKSFQNGTPAKAGAKGFIRIDINYIGSQAQNYDDNRLIIVLFHEIGHLHYFKENRGVAIDEKENEKYAFLYSLKRAKELADNGDCGPLTTGLKFMKQRSENGNPNDPHFMALSEILSGPSFTEYMNYVQLSCKEKSAVVYSDDKLKELYNDLITETDELSQRTFYYYRKVKPDKEEAIYLYIVKGKRGMINLRFRIQHWTTSPLDLRGYIITTNSGESRIIPKPNELVRKGGGRDFYSFYDVPCDANIISRIQEIISSDDASVKFIGSRTEHRKIKDKEKDGFSFIMEVYKAMGGKFSF